MGPVEHSQRWEKGRSFGEKTLPTLLFRSAEKKPFLLQTPRSTGRSSQLLCNLIQLQPQRQTPSTTVRPSTQRSQSSKLLNLGIPERHP